MFDRDKFLQLCAEMAVAGPLAPSAKASDAHATRDRLGELLPTRILGRTGEAVTMLGVGGANVSHQDDNGAERTIETALEGGVRFFDTAEEYHDGLSERYYGKYLVPKYRDVAFIMSKTNALDASGARKDLDVSLQRMGTDYLDLWQVHHVEDPADVDVRLEGGVLDAVQGAKESGKVRYIGFTSHSHPSAHQRMLGRTDIFDTCQMPVNLIDPYYESFIRGVLPTLVERNIGILAMKTLAAGGFFGSTQFFKSGEHPRVVPDCVSIAEALRFVWSLPVSVIITGANNPEQMQEKVEIARAFTPLESAERGALLDKVSNLTGPKVEFYKTDVTASDA